ncbi:MAG: hypothetical protein M3Z07_04810 [Candidatus Eremiobacteraeota bacterium]|nr:hypothetical protein [Candidatus Eremiobacteraeota bacterium]
MDNADAREHLEMVDRILSRADSSVQPRGTIFIIWGVAAAILNLSIQGYFSYGFTAPYWWILPAGAYVLAIAATIYYSVYCDREGRMSVTERQFLRILFITLATAFVGGVLASNIFTQWAQSAIWSLCIATPLLFIGVQGQRYALAGGVVLLASVVVANYTPHTVGLTLAVGDLIGYAGAGLAFELQRAKNG